VKCLTINDKTLRIFLPTSELGVYNPHVYEYSGIKRKKKKNAATSKTQNFLSSQTHMSSCWLLATSNYPHHISPLIHLISFAASVLALVVKHLAFESPKRERPIWILDTSKILFPATLVIFAQADAASLITAEQTKRSASPIADPCQFSLAVFVLLRIMEGGTVFASIILMKIISSIAQRWGFISLAHSGVYSHFAHERPKAKWFLSQFTAWLIATIIPRALVGASLCSPEATKLILVFRRVFFQVPLPEWLMVGGVCVFAQMFALVVQDWALMEDKDERLRRQDSARSMDDFLENAVPSHSHFDEGLLQDDVVVEIQKTVSPQLQPRNGGNGSRSKLPKPTVLFWARKDQTEKARKSVQSVRSVQSMASSVDLTDTASSAPTAKSKVAGRTRGNTVAHILGRHVERSDDRSV
jgi:hypothetical protein